ncbi:MAG: glycosyltransferase [Alloprevotella sp.]|nr:glycosyltransferase [Alloprevotella sp.]
MKYSFIIPVYNRPDEVAELLDSLCRQTCKDFEVIVVEDGSQVPCEDVVNRFADRLPVRYLNKPNSGPGQSRNYGVERASGDYVLILDSDVVLPDGYVQAVDDALSQSDTDAFGGPDSAHPSFTPTQKAINYAMTSFFTTGGIRGGKRKLDRFFPRSFNMGIKRHVYTRLGGFSKMRFGEDIDFSYRIVEAGFTTRLLPDAWVWHKRRTNFRKFFKQVHNSGIARIHLTRRHPGTLKIVHLLPAAFTLGCAVLIAGSPFCLWALLPLLLFALIVGIDASVRNRSLRIGTLAIGASFIQLWGYGTGFLRAWWNCYVLGKPEFNAFEKTFYQ